MDYKAFVVELSKLINNQNPDNQINENIFGPADRFNRGKILLDQITLLEKILNIFKFKKFPTCLLTTTSTKSYNITRRIYYVINLIRFVKISLIDLSKKCKISIIQKINEPNRLLSQIY